MKVLKQVALSALVGAHAVAGFAALSKIPSVEIFDSKFPDVAKVNVAEYVAGKNVVIVGLPGAFTPT